MADGAGFPFSRARRGREAHSCGVAYSFTFPAERKSLRAILEVAEMRDSFERCGVCGRSTRAGDLDGAFVGGRMVSVCPHCGSPDVTPCIPVLEECSLCPEADRCGNLRGFEEGGIRR